MASLKDRTRFPPGSFQVLIPEIGMTMPVKGSFNEVVTAFDKIVRANPDLARKHSWPTDRESQENWIDQREALRMIAHGWTGFVDLEGQLPAPPPPGGMRRNSPGVVAAAASGLAIYRDLFTTGKPVAPDVAEARANICATCPQNRTGSLKDFFVESVAKGLRELLSVMHDMKLTTTRDKELGTCAACMCPLKVKPWCELPLILKHMTPEQRDRLDPRCWILAP